MKRKSHVQSALSHSVFVCYYHLRRLFQLRSFVSHEASSNCARPSAHRQLQLCTCQPPSVYNRTATARSEYRSPSRLGLKRRAHITPALKKLHWLPVRQRITFKIATLVHRVQCQDCPPYLCDLVHFTITNTDCNRSRLRSATSEAATVVRTRTNQFCNRHPVCIIYFRHLAILNYTFSPQGSLKISQNRQ